MEEDVEAFREVNLSDGKCNVSLYVCAEEENKIDNDPEYASELFRAALEGRLPAAADDSETGAASDDNEDGEEKSRTKQCEVHWDSPATAFFLKLIKKNCNLLPLNTGSRKRLFLSIQEDLTSEGYNIPIESIRQKFNSLLTTYNRIKFKAKRIGTVKTRWEFYDLFDEIMEKADVLSSKDEANGTNDSGDASEPVDISKVKQEKECDDEDGIPTAPECDSSHSTSREASPEVSRRQKPTGKRKAPLKSELQESPDKVNKKRKLSKDREESTEAPKENSPSKMGDDVASEANNSMEGSEHVIIKSEGFNHAATLLFIDSLKKNKELLKTKKSAEMFSRIRTDMAREGYIFSEAKLRKKWYNLLISYRRILERANETGDLVSNWPYYEALDSIITDTKGLAQNNEKSEINGITESCGEKDVRPAVIPKGVCNKVSPVLEFLKTSNDNSGTKNHREDDEFKHIFLEDWRKREVRREARDEMKLNLLLKISNSIENMTAKQDSLIDILKKLQ